jgi:hypothetical protein
MKKIAFSLGALCMSLGVFTAAQAMTPPNQAPKQVDTTSGSFYDQRQVAVYFPETNREDLDEVLPVVRTTNRIDVAEFAIEQLLQGPNPAERDVVAPLPVELSGESVCGNQDFTVAIEDETAIVQFCRRVVRGGVGDDAALESSIKTTLKQFSTVDQVVLLNQDGTCLIDPSGMNRCFNRLP